MYSIIVIGTLTTSLQGIEAVGHSLETLTVTNTQLTRIEPQFLKLSALKHLNLGDN